MSLTIRKGTPGDLDALEQLYGEVCDHLAANVNYTGWKRDIYPVRQDAEAGLQEGGLFLAEENGEMAGSFILSHKQEPAYDSVKWQAELEKQDVLTVYTFAVSPRLRGRGTGRAMLEYASRYGAEHGVRALRLDVYEGNLPAIRLYESAGFRYVDTVSLGLEDIGLDWFRLYEKLLETPVGEHAAAVSAGKTESHDF